MSIIEYYGDSTPGGVLRYWKKKTKDECAWEISRCWKRIEELEAQIKRREDGQLPQGLEDFIAEESREVSYGRDSVMRDVRGDAVSVYGLRAWMTGHVRVPVEVIQFLRGEGPLEGLHFGDSQEVGPRKMRALYWWRKYLPRLNASEGE